MKLDRVIAVRNNKTVFRDGKCCVKIFAPDYKKTAVYSEALNHARVEECVDFVPKLLEVIRHDRSWAIVYEFVKGKTLLQWMEEEPEALSEQVAFLVQAQTRIHKASGQALESMKDCFLRGLEGADLEPSLKSALAKGLETMPCSSALCHGDFVPSNLIVGEEKGAVAIDWTYAMAGEPAADAAITYLLLKIRGRDAFAEAYETAYAKATGIPLEDIRKWYPYGAAYLTHRTNAVERLALLPYVKSMESKGETK